MEIEKVKSTHKSVLGKGLASLLPSVSIETVPEFSPKREYFMCPIEKIIPNPKQPRREFDEESIRELAESIKEKGIIQPLVVKQVNDGYMLIAGERRWRAAQKAKKREVPVIIKDIPDRELLEIALIENLQREDLSPIDTAIAFEKLIIDLGLTQEEISRRVGKDRSTIANALRLLKLPEEVREALSSKKITEGHARSLLALDNREDQIVLLEEIIKKGLSVREVEKRVKTIKEAFEEESGIPPTIKRRQEATAIQLEALERTLSGYLGTKVKILAKGDCEKGQVVVDFYTKEDLERIINLIQNRV